MCGGLEQYSDSQNCVVIGKPELETKMIEKRAGAASVVLNPYGLWIVGGQLYYDLSSTEFIKLGQPSVKGRDLPFRIYGHSMIQYDEKSIYIIGGDQNVGSHNGSFPSKKTWIVDQ